MVIYPQALLLSAAAAGASLINPRIGYENWVRDLDATAVTVSGELESGPRDAPLSCDTFTFWEAPALPATWVVNLGTTRRLDYVGVVANLGDVGANLSVETSIDGITYTALGGETNPGNNAPLMFLDDARDARWVRLSVGGTLAPRIAVVYAGLSLAMPRPPDVGFKPPNLARVTEHTQTLSRGGQFLGQEIRRMGVRTEISFDLLDADWYRTSFDLFVRAARRYPYFLAWHPESHPDEVAYCWTGEDFAPPHKTFDLMSVSWGLQGIGYDD